MKYEKSKLQYFCLHLQARLDEIWNTLVLSVNNYFIHFNKDTRSSKELPLDNTGKLESKMHDISNKWKYIDILFKALSKKKNLSNCQLFLGIKKKAQVWFRPDQFYI